MTIRLISFAALIALSAAPAFATAAPAPARRSSAPAAAAQQQSSLTRAQVLKNVDAQFKAIDTNGDGVLSQAELAAAEAKGLQNRLAMARSRMEAEFAKLDTNHDGQLSKVEFLVAAPQPPTSAPDVSAAFARLDTNKDGKVTVTEFSAAAAARFDQLDAKHAGVLNVTVPAGSPAKTISRADFVKRAAEEFGAIDSGHHGFVTKTDFAAAELKARQQSVAAARSRFEGEFAKLDTNRDNQLSLSEFMVAAPKAPTTAPNGADVMPKLDANHDGKVSLDEYRAPILARFDRLDANHDGVISPAERQAAQAQAAKTPKKR